MSIAKYTDEELRKELEKREVARRTVPKLQHTYDFHNVVQAFEDYNARLARGELCDDERGDFKQSIWEGVAVALYGRGYWDWHNKRVQ